MKRLKRFFRRKYLFWKYKRNKNSGKLLIQKPNDRQIGLTTMMINDCIKNNYTLYVPTLRYKNYIKSLYDVNILTPLDKLNTARDVNVVVDNSCLFEDVRYLCKSKAKIINGFVHEPFAK